VSLAIDRTLVGARVGPMVHEVDARWLMAYAACLGATDPTFMDTARPGGIAAHPLFPVCYEWPLSVELRASRFSPEVAIRSVHATHDLALHRLPRAGDRLSTTATVVGLERRAPGAYVLTRHDTVDAAGLPVSTTVYGSLHLGVDCEASPGRPAAGPPASAPAEAPERGGEPADWAERVGVAANLAHVYTECARIWNPIHTDLAAGLPDIILHGTATLALAVGRVLERTGTAPGAVRRIACRFGGMVRMPSTIEVRGAGAPGARSGETLAFQVLTEDGRPAVRDGRLHRT
jgi:acyl dehydratase